MLNLTNKLASGALDKKSFIAANKIIQKSEFNLFRQRLLV